MDLNSLLKSQWDRVGAVALSVLGAVFLLIGWIGVSGSAYLAEQAPYILSGGVGGVFLLGLGATLWISADLRDEWRKLDRIEAALGDGTLRWADDPVSASSNDTISGAHVYAEQKPARVAAATTAPTARVAASTARRSAAPARPRKARASSAES